MDEEVAGGEAMTHKVKKSIKPDKDLIEGLKELRYVVENPNKQPALALRGSIYRPIDKQELQILRYPPWVIGYKVVEDTIRAGFFIRTIFVKLPGENIAEVKEDQKGMMVEAISVLMDEGQDLPEIQRVAHDCMRFTQRFMVLYRKENKPGLVVPGGVGHA